MVVVESLSELVGPTVVPSVSPIEVTVSLSLSLTPTVVVESLSLPWVADSLMLPWVADSLMLPWVADSLALAVTLVAVSELDDSEVVADPSPLVSSPQAKGTRSRGERTRRKPLVRSTTTPPAENRRSRYRRLLGLYNPISVPLPCAESPHSPQTLRPCTLSQNCDEARATGSLHSRSSRLTARATSRLIGSHDLGEHPPVAKASTARPLPRIPCDRRTAAVLPGCSSTPETASQPPAQPRQLSCALPNRGYGRFSGLGLGVQRGLRAIALEKMQEKQGRAALPPAGASSNGAAVVSPESALVSLRKSSTSHPEPSSASCRVTEGSVPTTGSGRTSRSSVGSTRCRSYPSPRT